jgi:hypothetical protein
VREGWIIYVRYVDSDQHHDIAVSSPGSQTEAEKWMRMMRSSPRVAKVWTRIDRGAEWLAQLLHKDAPVTEFPCEVDWCDRVFDTPTGRAVHTMWHARVEAGLDRHRDEDYQLRSTTVEAYRPRHLARFNGTYDDET